ncbi:(2Fe-2S)-binding protein, partial [Xanthomonas oryzae]
AAENGCASLSELTMRTGCGSNCGSCLEMAGDLLNQVHPTRALPLPLLGVGQRCLM